jgi:hypothetical protein
LDHFTDEYNKRKLEIEQYLNLLELLDKDGAKISHFDEPDGVRIPNLSLQVSKASFYLIMYNLSEATVNAGVQSIYNKIRDEQLTFTEIIEKLQEVWWASHSDSLTNSEKCNLITKIYDLYKTSNSANIPDFNNFISGVSGNIDAESVRLVCHKYGISVVGDGRDLGATKTKRNWLSHGNHSFCDIGQDVVISDLINIKERTFIFLDEYVVNVSSYLEAEAYKLTV